MKIRTPVLWENLENHIDWFHEVKKDELQKREWFAAFMLDLSDGGSIRKGCNETSVSTETASGWKHV